MQYLATLSERRNIADANNHVTKNESSKKHAKKKKLKSPQKVVNGVNNNELKQQQQQASIEDQVYVHIVLEPMFHYSSCVFVHVPHCTHTSLPSILLPPLFSYNTSYIYTHTHTLQTTIQPNPRIIRQRPYSS